MNNRTILSTFTRERSWNDYKSNVEVGKIHDKNNSNNAIFISKKHKQFISRKFAFLDIIYC